LHGALDACLLPATAVDSATWAPDREFHLLDGIGHFVHQEAAAETTRLLAAFLSSL